MRIFVADNREHPDPDPSLTIEQVRDMMADFLPDLVGATWTETPREEDTIVDFQRRVGTKGTKYLVRRTIEEWTIVDEAENDYAAVKAAIDHDEWHHSDENYEASPAAEEPESELRVFGTAAPKFSLGQVVMTANLQHQAEESHGEVGTAARIAEVIRRHGRGDWGDLEQEDLDRNDDALNGEGRLFSAYDSVFDFKVWVVTEWDRSVTTVLLPEDY